jgi:SEC-C motif-containing protein
MTQDTACPCGSGKTFDQCCGPFISGEQLPPTAEALMRSRYTAYTLQNDDYLLHTWKAESRPTDQSPSDDDGTIWTGLEILRTEAGGANDAEGVVEFVAKCKSNGVPAQLHEISQFAREDGRWVYVDGSGQQPVRREHGKVGRNDPCICGSGKKFKKCCGR